MRNACSCSQVATWTTLHTISKLPSTVAKCCHMSSRASTCRTPADCEVACYRDTMVQSYHVHTLSTHSDFRVCHALSKSGTHRKD